MIPSFWARVAISLLLWTGAATAGSDRAHASPGFPGVMDETLSLGCEPSCALCHLDGETGFGTTNTLFGMKMRRETSLRCCDDDKLADALAQFRERGIDSDGDGTSDIDELVGGTDPNGEGVLTCERPYLSDGSRVFGEGCAAALPRRDTPKHGRGLDATATVLTVALVGLVVRVRTRRARRARQAS